MSMSDPELTRWSFGYPFLTDTIAMKDCMRIVPSGFEEVDCCIDKATGQFIASRLNEVAALRAEREQLVQQRAELLEAMDHAALMLERVVKRGGYVVGCDSTAKRTRAAIAKVKAIGSVK